MGNKIFLLLFAMLFLTASVSATSILLPDGDNRNITQCNTQLEAEGVFEIVNDLNVSAEFPLEDNGCIEIGTLTPNIIINGNGHTIRLLGQGNLAVVMLGQPNLNISINNITVISDNSANGNLLFATETGGERLHVKNVNLINMSYGLLVYPDEDLILNAENINFVGQTGNGFFSESDYLANSSISNLTITMLEGWDFGFLAVNNGINNLTLRNITFLDYAGRGKLEYKNSIPINVSGNFLLTEKDVRFYPNGLSLMRDVNNFTKGKFENVPATVYLYNMPSNPEGNYFPSKDGSFCSECTLSLYDPNTQVFSFNVAGAGNYSYIRTVTDQTIYSPLYKAFNSSGSGLGIFIQYLTAVLPLLILPLGMIVMVSAFTILLMKLFDKIGK